MVADGNTLSGKGRKKGANFYLYRDPVDYDYLEDHLDELDLSPILDETMEEQHYREGADARRFDEYERKMAPGLLELSDRERHLLFLKEEGKHNMDQRRRYLLYTRYERQQAAAADRLADAGGRLPANVHANFGEAMVEKHRRETQDMLKFREFERGLGDAGQSFSQRERYMLFLEQESHLSDEGREQFLRFLRHERAYLHEYNLEALGITIPGDYDSD